MKTIIVSNRLPINIGKSEGEITISRSDGGLVSGISNWLKQANIDYKWIGWPGAEITGKDKEIVEKLMKDKFNCAPVYLTQSEITNYYLGFCNETLWPLFHYFPEKMILNTEYWEDYVKVNHKFAQEVAENAVDGDTIFVQDYQLMLLPALLRKKFPNSNIGFFMHIPFPTFEIYRILPTSWRTLLLEGLLGADLIGFHTQEYAQYFAHSVQRILGVQQSLGVLNYNDRLVKVDSFALGINYNLFSGMQANPEVIAQKAELKRDFEGKKIIISIDRLDYSKGIANRLGGFEHFLKQHPEFHNKVSLIVTIVPSRTNIEEYQLMKEEIDQLVGQINGEFGDVNWTPIIYQYRNLDPIELAALYGYADIALVTPLRDGMNLIAKEFIASKTDMQGVLILSEFAGAAKELTEALFVNPNVTEEIGDAIFTALTMTTKEKRRTSRILHKHLKKYDVFHWADSYLTTLKKFKNRSTSVKNVATKAVREKILLQFKNAKSRLIILDYDGSLIEFASRPALATPTEEIYKIIEKLTKLNNTEVVICSGRERLNLMDWFGHLEIHIVAEHGVAIRWTGSGWNKYEKQVKTWKPQIRRIMERFVRRLHDSFIEEKEYSLAWHYRQSDDILGEQLANELADEIRQYTVNINIHVLKGNKVIEIKNVGVTKGTAVTKFINAKPADFILALGDDYTDEEMFMVMPKDSITIKVGEKATIARYRLNNPKAVRKFLNELAKV